MAFSLLHLPVVQNWDCHATGNCCREYRINVTEEERQRIQAQGWDSQRDLGGLPPFRQEGGGIAKKLRDSGFLTRDGRMKERKKYGRKGARKAFQFSKR